MEGNAIVGEIDVMMVAVDGDDGIGHAFEQAGLGARGRAVDLISEQELREDRTGAEPKLRTLHVIHGSASDI